MFEELREYDNVIKIFASNPVKKDCKFSRIKVQYGEVKNDVVFFATRYSEKQAFQSNIRTNELYDWSVQNIVGQYKQILIVTKTQEITYLTNVKGKVTRLCRNIVNNSSAECHNRRKNYILNDGDNIPALVDLGIFTKDYKVVNSMYDKFKQINRFVEILDDVFKKYDRRDVTVLDFGCGKSYLTFVIYHYLVKVRKINAKIIGYDLKSDVVDNCNKLAKKYGYDNLRFIVADVTKDNLCNEKIDAVVSLHACDTATDYALYYAVSHNVPYVFSVPCCQHEVNATIQKGGELDVLLRYGILKERVSALLTDGIRAMLLEDEGYSVDVMEFVDLAHSPKNLMIRAVKSRVKSNNNKERISNLIRKYNFKQTLYELLSNDRSD